MTRSRFAPTIDCRSCGSRLEGILDLGQQPSAGSFPRSEAVPEPLLPLRLAACPACTLVQLADETVPEVDLPGAAPPTSSSTMTLHARALVDDLIAAGIAGPGTRALSLASHGGHLWPFLHERSIACVAVEGSAAWAEQLRAQGAAVVQTDPVRLDWPPDGGTQQVDLVVEHYLLAHVARPDDLIAVIADRLRPGGMLVLEFDHLLATAAGLQFDAIRHGHHTYLTLRWLADALERHGLTPVHAEEQPVYGGALRVRAVRGPATPDDTIREVLDREAAGGVDRPAGFEAFVAGVDSVRARVLAYLEESRSAGRRVLGYGAPARAVTFLNAIPVGPALLPFTADRSAAKQGAMIPGVAVPIRSPEDLDAARPDDVLVLAWDLAAEIRQDRAALEAQGARFVVAIPELAIVTDGGLVPIDQP